MVLIIPCTGSRSPSTASAPSTAGKNSRNTSQYTASPTVLAKGTRSSSSRPANVPRRSSSLTVLRTRDTKNLSMLAKTHASTSNSPAPTIRGAYWNTWTSSWLSGSVMIVRPSTWKKATSTKIIISQ